MTEAPQHTELRKESLISKINGVTDIWALLSWPDKSELIASLNTPDFKDKLSVAIGDSLKKSITEITKNGISSEQDASIVNMYGVLFLEKHASDLGGGDTLESAWKILKEIQKKWDKMNGMKIDEKGTREEIKGYLEENREQVREMDQKAQKSLGNFIGDKVSGIKSTKEMLLWPTLDMSMSYVIGNKQRGKEELFKKYGVNMAYWWKEAHDEYNALLKEQWFPVISPQEMRKIAKVWYFSRVEAKPDGKFVAKHFPGWDQNLLLTHVGPVKFGPWNDYVKESLSLFAEIIKSPKPPEWIMIAHAGYDTSYFPGIEKIIERDAGKYPYLKNTPFDQIPASLNPYLITYLRENLWFQWEIIPDWFWGMKAYMEHVDKMDVDFTKDPIIKVCYLSIMTGNTFITGMWPNVSHIRDSKDWDTLREKHPDLYKQFASKCLEAVKPVSDKMWKEKQLNIPLGDLLFLMISEPEDKVYIQDKWNGEMSYWWVQTKKSKQWTISEVMTFVAQWSGSEDLAKAVIESGLSQNDIWTRTWVQTLIYRQAFISNLYEKTTGKKLNLPPYPAKTDNEDVWFDSLMSNKEFRAYYDNIDWEALATINS